MRWLSLCVDCFLLPGSTLYELLELQMAKSCFELWEMQMQGLKCICFFSKQLIIIMTCFFLFFFSFKWLQANSGIPGRLEAWWWVKLSLPPNLLNYSASNLPIRSAFVYAFCPSFSSFISLYLLHEGNANDYYKSHFQILRLHEWGLSLPLVPFALTLP